jgi:TolB-like protein/tetratricopeptide (TPR) repeat protein
VPAERAERRLAAILAADVAGYSRLMGVDEEGTLAALKAVRAELGDPKIAEHRGRIVKTTGDGMLVEFGSVVDAVRCAVAVQQGMAARNADVPVERRIEFRIGINLGDIISDDNDIYGDGVNVAARLEALAEPGGICVSRVVHDQVCDKLDVAFDDLGEQRVKNIARPVHVYRVRMTAPAQEVKPALALPDKPSLAVLPFQNMSGDPEQEYFADGMVEEITTAIARLPWLFVIARNSSFTYKGRAVDVKQVACELGVRYILEGSVRKAGNRVRITGQLIDTATGAHIWADRFDGALDDIFELQDQVASSVVGAIEPRLRQSEIERAGRKPTEHLDAYDLYLRAWEATHRSTERGFAEGVALLRQALAIDPSYAPAAAMVGYCLHMQRLRGGVIAEADVAEAVSLARHAVARGKDNPDALWMGGWALATLAFEHAPGLSAIERSLALNPNSSLAWLFCGWLHGFANRPVPAIDAFERSIRLNPLDPERWAPEGGQAFAHLLAVRYPEAVEWADSALHANPRATFIAGCKAAACGYLGRSDEGRDCIRRLAEFSPGFTTIESFKTAWEKFCVPDVLTIYLEGLRLAGLPEE